MRMPTRLSEMRDGVYYFVQLFEKLLFQHITITLKTFDIRGLGISRSIVMLPTFPRYLVTLPSHIFTCPISSCEVCIRSKQSFFLFSISLNKCTTPLELIYYDILRDYSTISRSRSTWLFKKILLFIFIRDVLGLFDTLNI